jgi:hypothetical protein
MKPEIWNVKTISEEEYLRNLMQSSDTDIKKGLILKT